MTLRALEAEADRRGILVVKEQTARVYGLTRFSWLKMLAAQGWVCGVCGKVPKTGRLVTDHEHARGWKRMPPEQRAKYVRGVCCWRCNRELLPELMTRFLALRVADYLLAYALRGESS